MRIAIAVVLCLVLVSPAVAQDRTVTVRPVTGPVQSVGPSDAAAVCSFGNLSTPALLITDWIWGAETYATTFRAEQPACAPCAVGFTVEQVHFYMYFSVADVPSTFNASVSFMEAEGRTCASPTAMICASPSYQISVVDPGLYDITLPMTPGGCACAYFGYDYTVAIDFPGAFPATQRPDAVTDDVPVGCTSYDDYGTGWTDLQTLGFPGELIMYADIACCEPAVPNDAQSWGGMKSLYR